MINGVYMYINRDTRVAIYFEHTEDIFENFCESHCYKDSNFNECRTRQGNLQGSLYQHR